MDFSLCLILIFVAVSIMAVVLTVYDKRAARLHKRRISEKTLMLIAFFGGAIAMYLTMLLLRHKTKHKKFMVGLPIMIVFHTIIIIKAVFL